MSFIRKSDYTQERERPNLLTHYLANMTQFLKSQNPGVSDSEIEQFIKQTIDETFKSPQVQAVTHKREGHSDPVKVPLHVYIKDIIKDNNLSPSGSCYKPVSQMESFLRQTIDGKVKERNASKKLYLDYEAQGMKRESQYYNQAQSLAKIFNNAIAGGMKITQFILGSKAGFNAITSVGRMSVKQGYSFIERAVNGNIYLPSDRDVLSYILNHAQNVPEEFTQLIERKTLYVPTVEDVSNYLVNSLLNYVAHPKTDDINRLLASLPQDQLSYVFYAGCINNLCRYNDEMMRTWLDTCFLKGDIARELYCDIDLSEIKKINGDVVVCVMSTNYNRLGLNPDPKKKGRWNSIKDAMEFNPDGVREFIYVCHHFTAQFERMLPVLKPILQIQTTFSRLAAQHRMARYTVPLSDTDSNIFSTQELIRWKRGKIDFDQESYEMNAIITFILSQSLEHVFARLSAGFGAEQNDVFKIEMKNEFLYPILMATSLAKHYLAIATMQEGSLLPTPRRDIKGVGFRSSAYPKRVKDGFEEYVVKLFEEIQKGEPIRATSILQHISGIEHEIAKSIRNKESDYLQTVSVRRKEDYADPAVSAYFYHDFWKEVFESTFGEMIVPNKCFKIPLRGGKKLFKDPEFMEELSKTHPVIHKNLVRFMENNPKRDIGAVLVPPFKGEADPFFVGIMDIRTHISQVMAGYYHLLDALGIGTVDRRASALVSDFHDPLIPEIE